MFMGVVRNLRLPRFEIQDSRRGWGGVPLSFSIFGDFGGVFNGEKKTDYRRQLTRGTVGIFGKQRTWTYS